MNEKRKLLLEAKKLVYRHKNFSPAFVSRKLQIGYESASKIIKLILGQKKQKKKRFMGRQEKYIERGVKLRR
jgi:DNA segregation ATPase FtsK/SpoIIIE-like protein